MLPPFHFFYQVIIKILGFDLSLIKERPDIGVYVKDLSNVTVSSADHMERIMQFGNAYRYVTFFGQNKMKMDWLHFSFKLLDESGFADLSSYYFVKCRSTGVTKMNADSSRSHALFTVMIECSEKIGDHCHITQGKLQLVDLAVSFILYFF